MKTYLINLFILFLIFTAYYTDFFELFTGKTALFSAIILVLIMLLIGWKIIGNPLAENNGKEKNDDKDK